jgi:hypothetical protein
VPPLAAEEEEEEVDSAVMLRCRRGKWTTNEATNGWTCISSILYDIPYFF